MGQGGGRGADLDPHVRFERWLILPRDARRVARGPREDNSCSASLSPWRIDVFSPGRLFRYALGRRTWKSLARGCPFWQLALALCR